MNYSVKTESFEGPLDLLLHLIKEQEVDIYQVSISKIAQQYLNYIEQMKVLNIEIAGNFIVMASEMTRIKSRSLLPRRVDDELIEGLDPEELLRERLIEYQKIKHASEYLSALKDEFDDVYLRQFKSHNDEGGKEYQENDMFQVEVSLYELALTFHELLKEKKETTYHVIMEEYSVEDIMSTLIEKINSIQYLSFSSFVHKITSRMELVATFLAILELLKLQRVKVIQETTFSDILIMKKEPSSL
ncbi:MAG: segregation/condensation protein A [Nitrospinae bacterium]|nr:segregation/condensation protein A [Nitrospinota bacterium]